MKFHIAKRDDLPWYVAWGIRIAAVIVALIVCGVITSITTKLNPISVYTSMIGGAFGSARKVWITFQNLSILLLISLALTPAFKMRFWNIGGEGQVLVGALATAAVMVYLGENEHIPQPIIWIIMAVAAMLAGAIWAVIPALFKAKWNTNETLSTLMMNYIATQLVSFFVILWEVPKGSFTVGIINQKSRGGWLPELFGNIENLPKFINTKYLLPIVVALAATIIMFIYLKYSKHGYEISVVGESEKTAEYVGMKTGWIIIRTMLLSGSICGIAGLLLVGSINHTITTTLCGGQGFTAVMVSWLAKFNPFTMIISSFILVFLERGADEISTTFDLNQSFSDILTGIILFFIIGCEFFIRYKIKISGSKSRKEDK